MKKIKLIMSAALLSCCFSIPAIAGQWQQDDIGWWWQNDDGSYLADCWQWLDGNNDGIAECYYFDKNGYMLSDTVSPDGYVLNSDGAIVINGVVQTRNVAPSADTSANGSVAGDTVFISRTGTKYHKDRTCGTMRDPIEMSLQDAVNSGYTACDTCF